MNADGTSMEPEELILYSGTVINATWRERIDAAVAGGFAAISLFPRDYRAARAEGHSDADLRAQLADAAIRVAVIDPYTKWWPGSLTPPEASDFMRAYGDTDEAEIFSIADVVGAQYVNCLEFWGVTVPVDDGAEAFAAACDRAAERGLRLHLECMPYSGVPDLAASWAIVHAADRPNGGLMLDTWHHLRGPGDNELLRRIPGNKLFALQLADGPAAPEGALAEDSMHRRQLPGDGAMDLADILDALAVTGATPTIGPEVFSDALNAQLPERTGRQAADSTRRVLRTSWSRTKTS